MRKIFLHFAMMADGLASNVEQWVSFTVDAIIFGNNNYAPLAEYWQNAETASDSAAERAFARKVNDMHKLVSVAMNIKDAMVSQWRSGVRVLLDLQPHTV